MTGKPATESVGVTETQTVEEIFGKPIFTYTDDDGVEDGVLANNPRRDNFEECSLVTANLLNKIEKIAFERTAKNVFEVDPNWLMGCLMLMGKDIYENKKFKGDNDKDFFVTPKNEEGLVVWFVRNGQNKLTAMLPEDY